MSLPLQVLLVVLVLLTLADAVDRLAKARRDRWRRLQCGRKRLGRSRVWYSPCIPGSHVRVIVAEHPAGTFIGWLDSHPYQPTNQPKTQEGK